MRIVILSIAVCVLLAENLLAKETHKNLLQRVEELSETINAITTETALGEKAITTASGLPNIEGGESSVYIDVLLWKAKIDGTAYAATNNRFSVAQPIEGYVKEENLGWDFGFKIGVEKQLSYDHWSLWAEFTYFKTEGSSSVEGNIENAIIPLKGPYSEAVQVANSQVRFNFLNLDIDLSRAYFVSKTVSLNPFVGIKNTWNVIKQEARFTRGIHLRKDTAAILDQSKMWGIGPQLGMDTHWYIGNGFHGFGLFSASLLYSYFQIKQDAFVTPSEAMDLFIRQSMHRFIPNMNLSLGMVWSRYLNQKKNYLELSLVYETQYYWKLNETFTLYQFNDSLRTQNSREDVALYGVTFQINFFF
jgi:hypothetical protein